MRFVTHAVFALILLAVVLASVMYMTAVSAPEVRRARIGMADWPAGARPIRVLLLSDIHVDAPDMPPRRLRDIVAQLNGLKPDLVLIAGDLVGDKGVSRITYSADEIVAPLAGLKAPLGIVAVLGNHDHWSDAERIRYALSRRGIRVLANEIDRRGPVIVAGLDDPYTGRADVGRITRALAGQQGPVVVLSHSPDVAPELPARAGVVLAGHTHCGQIAPPLIGAVKTMSRYGDRYACGVVREGGRTVVVGAGLGTSLAPLRLGAVPDVWLVTLGPAEG